MTKIPSALRLALMLWAFVAGSTQVARAQPPFEVVRLLLGGTYPTSPIAVIHATDGHFYALTYGGAFSQGTIVRITPAGVMTVVHTFTNAEGSPYSSGYSYGPSSLIQASDGNLYGTTYRAVFKMSLAGEFTLLHVFGEQAGSYLPFSLVEGHDGYFYGLTLYGSHTGGCYSSLGCGTIFKITAAGDTATIFRFSGNGLYSADALIRGADGDLYGTASGQLFRLTTWGGAFAVIAEPGMVLKLQASDGNFYGTASGQVISVTPGGWVTVVHAFLRSSNFATLIEGTDGDFYGSQWGDYGSDDGPDDYGLIFRMSTAGDMTILHDFNNYLDGGHPVTFQQGPDGVLYGATSVRGVFGAGSIFVLTPGRSSLNTIKSLSFGAEGSSPQDALVQGIDGNFYGTTNYGGDFNGGTVFRMAPSGALTVLQSFRYSAYPSGLKKGSGSELFGITRYGGAFGHGTIFRMTPVGVITVIHDFTGQAPEYYPNSIVLGPDGNLYGTNYYGLFRVTPTGTFTLVTSGNFGSAIFGSDGKLYATGFVKNPDTASYYNLEAIFKVALDGTVTVLHTMNSGEGSSLNGIVQSYDGNFYGTARYGGPGAEGTAFRISTDGAFSVLHAFGGGYGSGPAAPLIEASDGNFYGVTGSYGGSGSDGGTVFRMTRQGTVTVLHSFGGCCTNQPGGSYPSGALTQGDDGNLYGVTSSGGVPSGAGLIYRLNFHLVPPDAPTLVRVAPAANRAVRLTWSQPLGATSFAIKRALADGSYVTLASGLTSVSYVDTAVTTGQRYHYVVTALNDRGESVGSYDVAITAGRTTRGDVGGSPFSSGIADLVWRHSSGDVTIWLMRDFSVIGGGLVANVDPAWTIAGRGDYDGDGRADILWRHTSSGAVTIWSMNGAQIVSGGLVSVVDPAWQIVASGDFDGDGRDDIVWRHASSGALSIWLMNGTQVIGGGLVDVVDPAWQIAAAGDFNGDGRTDLLWRQTSGVLTVWLMNGRAVVGGGMAGWADLNWQIAGSGDYDGDGRDDILWRSASGAVTVWLMNGTETIGGGPLRPYGVVDPAWQIVQRGDYNGDGRADILWRNPSGTVRVWFMEGAQLVSGAEVGQVDPAWQIVDAP